MWTVEEAIPTAIKQKLELAAQKPSINPNVYLIAFLEIISELKKCERTGWIGKIPKPESVADHMYRMSIICMLYPNDDLDIKKCVMIALCHDMAEAIVGDITPYDTSCNKDEKHRRELEAMKYIHELVSKFNPRAGQSIQDLWNEYEFQTTAEGKFVKDVDKFELLSQTSEYLRMHPEADINEMMRAKASIKTQTGSEWTKALEEYNELSN